MSPLSLPEPELLDGRREWSVSQDLFRHEADPTRMLHTPNVTWYDTATDNNDGAFCLIQQGSQLEDLVGDIVQVTYLNKKIWVYCVGGSNLKSDLALARSAFFRLAILSKPFLRVRAQATVNE